MSDSSPAHRIGFVQFTCLGCRDCVSIIGLDAIPEPPYCDACHMEAVRLAICIQERRPQPLVWTVDGIMERLMPRAHLDAPEHP